MYQYKHPVVKAEEWNHKEFTTQLAALSGMANIIFSTLYIPMIRFSSQNNNRSGNTSQPRKTTP
jgi:hypothetical protein